jgi:hypothetical protein
MVGEGEFKKRIKENRDALCAKAVMIAMKEWIQEAKQEFPKKSEYNSSENMHLHWHDLLDEWFVKWFGEDKKTN